MKQWISDVILNPKRIAIPIMTPFWRKSPTCA